MHIKKNVQIISYQLFITFFAILIVANNPFKKNDIAIILLYLLVGDLTEVGNIFAYLSTYARECVCLSVPVRLVVPVRGVRSCACACVLVCACLCIKSTISCYL